MKNNNMIPNNPLENFAFERNHNYNTKTNYEVTLKQFEDFINIPLTEMLIISKNETTPQNWVDSQLRKWLIKYRNYIYSTYKEGTAATKLTQVQAVFNHYNIYIGHLPYFSKKQTIKSEEIDYEDLPNREILRKCIGLDNPLLKAMTLFMSSSGLSKTDTWKLTIQNYLDATREYHNTNNIYAAIEQMNQSQKSIIPTFKLRRQKTGETYRTFCSPEATKAINIYLLSREEPLSQDSRLFDVNFRYINDLFQKVNDKLSLGKVNGIRRFTPQMLRSYHASQLSESGMNDSNIDILQGRKPTSIARKSYIRVKREKLKEEYIKALPFLVVEDIEEVRSELDIVKDENKILKEKEKEINDLWEEINNMKARQSVWNELKKD